jgi:hypothetical protein
MNLAALIIALFLTTSLGLAQDPIHEVLKANYSDVAVIKEKAEAGDPNAQLSLADTYSFNFKKADALGWYRKAAENGVVESESRLGEMLLFGASGIPASQNVPANPVEGIRWTYQAATNGNAKAWLNMSKAFQYGSGVSKDPVEAYAWLELYADTVPIEGPVMLNQMALSLDTASIQQAQTIVAECRSGQWPAISPRKIAAGDPRLRLEGITFGGKVTLATINGKTLEEGESANVSLKKDVLKITCIKIKEDSVLVLIDGEYEPRWLFLK